MKKSIIFLLIAMICRVAYAQPEPSFRVLDHRTHQYEQDEYFQISVFADISSADWNTMTRVYTASVEDTKGAVGALNPAFTDAYYSYDNTKELFLIKPTSGFVNPAKLTGSLKLLNLPDCDILELDYQDLYTYHNKNMLRDHKDVKLCPIDVEQMNSLRYDDFEKFKEQIEKMIADGIIAIPQKRDLDDLIRDIHDLINDSQMGNVLPFLITDPEFKLADVQVIDDQGNVISQSKRKGNQLRLYFRKNPQPLWKLKVFVENERAVKEVAFVVDGIK